jgi:hypothetical protein
LLCYLKSAAWDIAAYCGRKLYELADPKFVRWHGVLERRIGSNVPRITGASYRIEKFEVRPLGVEFAERCAKVQAMNRARDD